MVTSIFEKQNDDFLLKCLLTQRMEYSKAKRIAYIRFLLTLCFFIFSVIANIFTCDLLSSICGLFAVIIIVVNKYTSIQIKNQKKHAASIQQYIDVSLYSAISQGDKSEWGDLPAKSEVIQSISKYDCTDFSELKNWYDDYSSFPSEYQIFYSQKENIRWSDNLLKSYFCFLIFISAVATILSFGIFILFNPSLIKFLAVCSWIVPIIEYTAANCMAIKKNLHTFTNLCNYCNEIEKQLSSANSAKIKKKLIELQYKIRTSREESFLVPDWFYQLLKKSQQKKENRIANIMAEENTRKEGSHESKN